MKPIKSISILNICMNCGHNKHNHINNDTGCLIVNKIIHKTRLYIYCPCQKFTNKCD